MTKRYTIDQTSADVLYNDHETLARISEPHAAERDVRPISFPSVAASFVGVALASTVDSTTHQLNWKFVSVDPANKTWINAPGAIDSSAVGLAIDAAGAALLIRAADKDNNPVNLMFRPDCSIWAKITGSASLATNRWKYSWTQQIRTATGFADLANGLSGTTTTDFAINSVETNNPSSPGVVAPGFDTSAADYPPGFSLQPIKGDPVVRLYRDYYLDGSDLKPVWTFQLANTDDGSCT